MRLAFRRAGCREIRLSGSTRGEWVALQCRPLSYSTVNLLCLEKGSEPPPSFSRINPCKEELRLHDLVRDFRHTLRRLARTPVFTLATLVTLALGIGANTAIFTVINSVLLKPLPYPEPGRLVAALQTAPGVGIKDLPASIADYLTYREDSRTFADIALWNGRSVTVTEFSDPERVDGLSVTFGLLPMLGIQPALGRGFTEKDNNNGTPDVLLLSHGYWQRRFGGDPKVIGRRIMADGVAREIIGVLPEGFWFMDMRHDLVMPIRWNRANITLGGYNSNGIARLRPGVTIEQANADVARMIGLELARFPPPKGMSTKMFEEARLGPNVQPLKDNLVGDLGKSLWVVMATIGIVLLIACANVANLLLVRTEGRSQELAVRAALGASRGRIARELIVESLALALAGGALGVGFAIAMVKLVLKMSPARLPRLEQVSLDSTTLLFTLVVSLTAGLVFGAIPVFKHGGLRLAEALRAGGRNASSGRDRNIARNTLTAVQVALALVLLIGSGLMIRTFQSMRRVHPGFSNPEALQTLRLSIPRNAVPKDPELLLLQQNLVNRLAAVPGVETVSLISHLPMTGMSGQDPIFASDRAYTANQLPPLRRYITVAPGTFSALGTPLRAGREFSWPEIHQKRQVILISENFAREYWGSAQAAIGKQIRGNPINPWSEIIGVVADIHHDGADKKAPTTVYWPQRSSNSMIFLIRGQRAGSDSYSSEIRQAVWAVNNSLAITDIQTMKQVYDKSMSRTAFTLTLLAISGGMALMLAVVGIYAVISYAVAQRTREIGIRMALGAQPGELKMLFVRNGLLWGAIGAAAGLAASAALSRAMSALLFEISPIDPLTYSVVAAGLLAAAALASYLPARRVTHVDPTEALRAD
ncbi:MAG: ABC transporter permease [Acidobacteria bacterium]|nr:ABC transporter permease [Acidobacteriota bacterium]